MVGGGEGMRGGMADVGVRGAVVDGAGLGVGRLGGLILS